MGAHGKMARKERENGMVNYQYEQQSSLSVGHTKGSGGSCLTYTGVFAACLVPRAVARDRIQAHECVLDNPKGPCIL